MPSYDEQLDQLIEGLKTLRSQLEKELNEAELKVDAVKKRMRRVDRMIGEPSPPRSPKKPKGKHLVSSESMNRVKAVIDDLVANQVRGAIPDIPGSFTILTVAERTEIHRATVQKAIQELREQGAIRQVGSAPRERYGSKLGQTPRVYAAVSNGKA